MSKIISGLSISDEEAITTMKDVFKKYSYTLDPHGAVGIAAWEKIYSENKNAVSIVLETAHPAKFIDRVEEALQSEIVLPPALERLKSKTKKADLLSKDFSEFKKYLLSLPK
jgi:threonine synthase